MGSEASAVPTPWEDAARMAGRIVQPGPDVSRAKAEQTVTTLRDSAHRAAPLAQRLSQMSPADGRELTSWTLSRIYIVDRPGWALGAARSIDHMLASPTPDVDPSDADQLAGSSNVEIAAALTFLSRKTLGQFDPFGPSMGPVLGDPAWPLSSPDPRGNLILVAPNILANQRAMAVDFEDFALWVSLHEQTHALQFAAAPWLKDHLKSLVTDLMTAFPTDTKLREWARTAASVMRGGHSMVDLLLTGPQREIFAQITTVMSVLEGHADVVMDLVSPQDIADLAILRRKFNARRSTGNRRSQMVMRLSGMDTKMDQYRSGAKFVEGVRKRVGLEGFNRVWAHPNNLPTPQELDSPYDWIARVTA